MLYNYSATEVIKYKKLEILPQQFHKAMCFNNEIFVYWGEFNDAIAEQFTHHTALLAFNSKGKLISALGFGQEGYIEILKSIERLCDEQITETYEGIYEAREGFLEAIDKWAL